METPEITPDGKDWTYVITDGCPQCGFTARLEVTTTPTVLRDSVPLWQETLARSDVRDRPHPTTWSPLEYGCHVRDVCRVFRGRLELMLTDDDARFADWDQDAAAVDGRYHEQDPDTVAAEYAEAAESLASVFDGVEGEQWDRRGQRSNGSQFTVATFAVYLVHDLEHHRHDVTPRA